MEKKVNVVQFHPLPEEELFHALREISDACLVVAWIHSVRQNPLNDNDAVKKKLKESQGARIHNAIQVAVALGVSGIPVNQLGNELPSMWK